MLLIIGFFILSLGILLDDVTTLILISNGYGIFETNPIYRMFGAVSLILIMIIVYLFIYASWYFMITTYPKLYETHKNGYKIYDIFIFIFCVFIIFFSSTKIEMGYNNIKLMIQHMDEEQKIQIDNAIIQAQHEYNINTTAYNKKASNIYAQNIIYDVGYIKMFFCIIMGYLLFRVGYKVMPYEYA